MIQGHTTSTLKRLVLGGALAALLAVGAAGAGVAGDPSQWGVTAGDPSQWGQVAGDPSQWGLAGPTTTRDPQEACGTGANDPQTALNFTKVEHKTSSLNFAKIEF